MRIEVGLSSGKRGQTSIEYLMIMGFTVILLFPLTYLFYTQSSTFEAEVAATHTDKIAQKIVEAADSVYYWGEPSQQTLTVFFPEQVRSVNISQNSVTFTVAGQSATFEVVKWSVANLTGSINPTQGTHHITLAASASGVEISE